MNKVYLIIYKKLETHGYDENHDFSETLTKKEFYTVKNKKDDIEKHIQSFELENDGFKLFSIQPL